MRILTILTRALRSQASCAPFVVWLIRRCAHRIGRRVTPSSIEICSSCGRQDIYLVASHLASRWLCSSLNTWWYSGAANPSTQQRAASPAARSWLARSTASAAARTSAKPTFKLQTMSPRPLNKKEVHCVPAAEGKKQTGKLVPALNKMFEIEKPIDSNKNIWN